MADRQHDDEFTADELREMEAGLALIHAQRYALADGGEADDGESSRGWHYERVRGVVPPGSFRLPLHAARKLGAGDGRTAGGVLKQLFDVDPSAP